MKTAAPAEGRRQDGGGAGPGAASPDPLAGVGREGPMSLEAARAACRALATSHYENFSVLTRLVPARLRDDFAAVYSYCRVSDDLADETGADEAARARSLELLGEWRAGIDRCFDYAESHDIASAPLDDAERPRHPVHVALASTIRKHELPREPFHRLIDAFEQDQRVTRYRTWDELIGYCTGSADPVGRIVLGLAGHRLDEPANAERVAMSDATCTALQLTNFWQDVRRDLEERDRVYLPSEETGLDAETLREWIGRGDDPAARVAYIRAVRPLVERTRALFERGRPLVGTLAAEMRPVVWLFGAGGERVLTRVERMGCATLWGRPRLTRVDKGVLLARAAIMSAFAGR
ncbi:MAG: squalene synthase HpnC [Planctomycetota bacterium]|nr:squalene synthase HpnC [Planctomycetota bacterium]